MKNNTNHTVRPVEPADLDELLVMMQEHADFERAHFTPEGKKDKLHSALFQQPPKLQCWVVSIAGKLVGFVSYTFDYSTWDAADFMYMDCLFLRGETRGKGIGTQIIEKLKTFASESGCYCIQWQTPVFNKPAIRFYHKNGAESADKVRFTLKLD